MSIQSLSDGTYRQIAALIHQTIGLNFGDSKKTLVSSRLTSRITQLGMGGFEDYLAHIAGPDDGGEFQVAIDLLTTNETYFFREPQHFERLQEELPQMQQAALMVWSAASSFGDEAYSVAMVMADLQQQGRIGSGWSVLATDISDRVLRSASQAIYPAERLRQVAPARLKRYCLQGHGESEGLVQIQPGLRERVRFGQLNLCLPIDLQQTMDVVFLRNVLIYFDGPTKHAVVDRVLGQLRVGGLFFIGMAEGRVVCDTPLQMLAPGVFRKLPAKAR